MATPLDEEVAARIRRRGPIGFAEVMELALYDPDHGFYAAGGAAGRRGDFLTSPEVGPLFGAVIARALDAWWDEAGRPDPFVVVEAAAGSGMLARTVLRAAPACAPALSYVLVERSAALRAGHGDHLELATPELAFPPDDEGAAATFGSGADARAGGGTDAGADACWGADDDTAVAAGFAMVAGSGADVDAGGSAGSGPTAGSGGDTGLGVVAGAGEGTDVGGSAGAGLAADRVGRAASRPVATGPRIVSLGSLPALRCAHVVLANELLDNLPITVLEATGAGGDGPDAWSEVRVALAADDTTLVELAVPASPADAARARALVPGAAPGSRIPLAGAAVEWVRDALAITVPGGRVVVIDYGAPTAELAARESSSSWLRTYRAHGRGSDPLDALGTQDITCDVPLDQLTGAGRPSRVESQAELLRRYGIDDLVEEGRAVWRERAHIGDLAALTARSRIREADALLDPEGLGAFTTVEWRAP